MKRNIKKASVKFRKNLVYADFCLYPKSVIITTLRYGIEKIFFQHSVLFWFENISEKNNCSNVL